MHRLKKIIISKLATKGYRVSKIFDLDVENEFIEMYKKVKEFTMTPLECQHALFRAMKYIVEHKIDGDIVECGVWRGGSAMISALTLKNLDQTDKKLYLYDTYTGMSEPTEKDVSAAGRRATEKWEASKQKNINTWAYASLEEVEHNMISTGYPKDKMFFIEGKVEETIPKIIPEKISLLRLDTDWYESTRHELEHLFPRLVKGGILIIDDYGNWQGSRMAVDEYFKNQGIKMFLNRMDFSARIGVKI
jgi:O-methyltransferase